MGYIIKKILFAVLALHCASGNTFAGWKDLLMRETTGYLYLVSSELQDPGPYRLGPYGGHNLFDNDPSTCWAEGKEGYGKGEKVFIIIDEGLKNFTIKNGYTKNSDLFKANNRIKKIRLTVRVGINLPGVATETGVLFHSVKYKKKKTLRLKDSILPQEIIFPFNWKKLIKFKTAALKTFKLLNRKKMLLLKEEPSIRFIMGIEILKVYKGTQYANTCLSSISFGERSNNKIAMGSKLKIYVNELQNTILMTSAKGETEVLVSDKKSIFQIVEVSPDSKWVIVIHMPANITHTRIQTDYYLYNTGLHKKVPKKFISKTAGELYGFEGSNSKTFLLYADNAKMQDDKILLSEIYEKLTASDKN